MITLLATDMIVRKWYSYYQRHAYIIVVKVKMIADWFGIMLISQRQVLIFFITITRHPTSVVRVESSGHGPIGENVLGLDFGAD